MNEILTHPAVEAGPGDRPIDAIQPHGFALLVDKDWRVLRSSANLDKFLAVNPAHCAGVGLSHILTDDAVHSLRNRVAMLRQPLDVTRLFACRAGTAETRFDFVVRTVDGSILIEGRPSGRTEHGDTAEVVRALIGRLDAGRGVNAVLGEAVLQLRAMTGYDRVACYGFAETDPKTLVAESARKLGTAPSRLPDWFERGMQLMIDGDGAGVALLPEGRGTTPLPAVFSAVNAEQQAWLSERGAVAAMTGALGIGTRIWGSIVCDHPTARPVTIDRQATFELYADMLAMKLEIATLRAGSG